MLRMITPLGVPARGPLIARNPTSAQNVLPSTTTSSAVAASRPSRVSEPPSTM